MKRIFSLMAVCLLALGLAACGSSPASSGEPKDYVAILTGARPAKDNEDLVIFHLKDGAYTATGGYAGELTEEDIASQGAMCLQVLGLAEEDVEEAAFSVSMMNVQSYGLAIVKPAEGRQAAVTEGLQAFIDSQKAAQENYLADQYAIAKAARLDAVKSGEVVLVMCAEQDAVFSSIKDALA
ncbi:DUF4358 domain-containing protein [Candidatus Allofournierella excrementigallinarum]|uniref:DUF4358 domain-containing protein n=1 Tax=Candidatus Allofournierella excrementigallinarum TaxID=2838592 RepID=UPI00374F6A5C